MTSPPPVDPLTPARRRELTREHLLRAAAEVFAARGFHGASLDEVAAAAGFSKGAVYSNFHNKEDLFLALLGSIYTQALEELRETIASSEAPGLDRLADFVELVRPRVGSRSARWSILYEEFHLYALRNPAVRERLAELDREDIAETAAIIEEERVRQGLAPLRSSTDTARIIIALMRGVSMMRDLEPELAHDDRFLETVIEFVARSLVAAP